MFPLNSILRPALRAASEAKRRHHSRLEHTPPRHGQEQMAGSPLAPAARI